MTEGLEQALSDLAGGLDLERVERSDAATRRRASAADGRLELDAERGVVTISQELTGKAGLHIGKSDLASGGEGNLLRRGLRDRICDQAWPGRWSRKARACWLGASPEPGRAPR